MFFETQCQTGPSVANLYELKRWLELCAFSQREKLMEKVIMKRFQTIVGLSLVVLLFGSNSVYANKTTTLKGKQNTLSVSFDSNKGETVGVSELSFSYPYNSNWSNDCGKRLLYNILLIDSELYEGFSDIQKARIQSGFKKLEIRENKWNGWMASLEKSEKKKENNKLIVEFEYNTKGAGSCKVDETKKEIKAIFKTLAGPKARKRPHKVGSLKGVTDEMDKVLKRLQKRNPKQDEAKESQRVDKGTVGNSPKDSTQEDNKEQPKADK